MRTIKELESAANRQKETQKKRLKEHYELARSLGFDSYMSQLVSNRSKANIHKAAAEAGLIDVGRVDVTDE